MGPPDWFDIWFRISGASRQCCVLFVGSVAVAMAGVVAAAVALAIPTRFTHGGLVATSICLLGF